MAKVFLVGGRSVNVSSKKGKDILNWKQDGAISKDRLLDLGSGKFEELRNIKGVDLELSEIMNDRDQERNDKIKKDIEDWKIYEAQCKAEDVETKAKRTLDSWCALLWTSRGNRPVMKIKDDLKIFLMERLLNYFTENPKEWHAERNIYEDLIPYGTLTNISKVKGFKTMGEMFQTKLI